MPVFHVGKTPEKKTDKHQKKEDSEYFEKFFHTIHFLTVRSGDADRSGTLT
jgi:hypothetical protein